jgi:hypothetical protein
MNTPSVQRWVHGRYGNYAVVGDSISKGGVGAIFRTTDPKWVYKEYHSPDKAPRREHLEQLVTVGREVLIQQGKPIGSQPESSVNWPVDIVDTRDGRIRGCVLPAIPDRYFHKTLGNVNTLDFLVMRRSSPPQARFRLIVLLRMAEILAFVNSKKLVHGDVNAKNVAWTLDPEPSAYLIDCDGMVPQDPPPTTGVQANYWTDPRVIDGMVPAHDHYSDWYCLALAFYRGMLLPQGGNLGKQNGTWAAPGQIPSDLDPRIATLLRRGLTDPLDPSKRPEPAEWARTLIDVYVVNNGYDDAAIARLDRSLPVRKPPTNFHPLPPTLPPRPAPVPQYQPAPTYQRQPPPPPRPPLAYPPPPPPPVVQWPLPVIQQYPVPAPHRPPPPPSIGKRPGSMARWAMGGGARWYVPLVLMMCACWPVGAIVSAVVLVQTLQTERGYYGRTAAIISSGVALGVCALFGIASLASAVSSPSTP